MTREQMAEIRTYKIYRHMLPNGKTYIGLTSAEKLYDRFDYGGGYKTQPFGKALVEFGWSQVKTDILAELEGDYYMASAIEEYWIQKHVVDGYDLCNKAHAAPPKESKYNCGGCTILDTNTYYETFAAAARFIGVTTQGVRNALANSKVCKGWRLEYGDATISDEELEEVMKEL